MQTRSKKGQNAWTAPTAFLTSGIFPVSAVPQLKRRRRVGGEGKRAVAERFAVYRSSAPYGFDSWTAIAESYIPFLYG